MDRAFSIFVYIGLFLSGLLGLAFVAGGAVVLNRADKLSLIVAGLTMLAVGSWGCIKAERQALAISR